MPKRRWFRYSMRTLLVLMLLVSAGMSWMAVKMRDARRQREAVETIRRSMGVVKYDCEIGFDGLSNADKTLPGPAWLRHLMGDDFFFTVVEADLQIHANQELHEIFLQKCCSLDDDGLRRVASLCHLRRLNLTYTRITDAGLGCLRTLTRLEALNLTGTNVTEQGVKKLGDALPNCTITR